MILFWACISPSTIVGATLGQLVTTIVMLPGFCLWMRCTEFRDKLSSNYNITIVYKFAWIYYSWHTGALDTGMHVNHHCILNYHNLIRMNYQNTHQTMRPLAY